MGTERLPAEKVAPFVRNGVLEYVVTGVGITDLITCHGMDEVNAMLCDERLEEGWALMDISYRFEGPVDADGTVGVRVHADASEWLREAAGEGDS